MLQKLINISKEYLLYNLLISLILKLIYNIFLPPKKWPKNRQQIPAADGFQWKQRMTLGVVVDLCRKRIGTPFMWPVCSPLLAPSNSPSTSPPFGHMFKL
jgi:hypothetical protein